MASYETEEQQVEALKEWWKQNGIAVITGAGLGIGALFGWWGWTEHKETQAQEASDIFTKVQEAIITNNVNAVTEHAKSLQENYTSTPYASLASLYEAKINSEKGDLTAAEQSLRWVIDHSKQDDVKNIARIRLSRVLIAENKLDEAAAVVNSGMSDAYLSLVNEVRGDIFVAKGEIEQARQAYDQALQNPDADNIEFLQLKRDNLGS